MKAFLLQSPDSTIHIEDDICEHLQAIEDFLAEGQAAGSVHADVTALDIAVCGTLIATPLPHGPEWSTAARRHLGVFVRGLRARGAEPGPATMQAVQRPEEELRNRA